MAQRFAGIGLVREMDFLLHLPTGWKDETHITPLSGAVDGEAALFQGRVTSSRVAAGFGRQLAAVLDDGTGHLRIRFLYFNHGLERVFSQGNHVRVFGKVRTARDGCLELVHPSVTKIADGSAPELPDTLTAIYQLPENIPQKTMRKRVQMAFRYVTLRERVPAEFTRQLGLPSFEEALHTLHGPSPGTDVRQLSERSAPAWQRIKFEELLVWQIRLRRRRLELKQRRAWPVKGAGGPAAAGLEASLPYPLTSAQRRVLSEIAADMAAGTPMSRLLQGDVGSGKTVVAALSVAVAVDAGFQAAFMVPTELLAEQHYRQFSRWFSPLGVQVAWLAGSLTAGDRKERLAAISSGDVQIVVGTHALIQKDVGFRRLALAVIDEQQRFGVDQRSCLERMGVDGQYPHVLMLSATPIPRTLAMGWLSDIDVSVIDELPAGRRPVSTRLVSMERLDEVASALDGAFSRGAQCYWVCPLIGEDDGEQDRVTPALSRARMLRSAWPSWRVGLVHGEMTAPERNAVMSAFIAGEIDVLVATTIIEVGVDVPQATMMVIENAERFGLSQLHQLRGRVGRGSTDSYCLLLFDPALSETGRQRLMVIRASNDGFVIAEEDLKLRGPGEILGSRQSGAMAFRYADPLKDTVLLSHARDAASMWMSRDKAAATSYAELWLGPEHVP